MSKHTLGPWEVRKSEPWVIAKAYGNMKSVVHLNLPIEQSEEQRANARLIAAAPDLLEVLKAFSDYVRDEQMATDGAVTYPTTAINHWAFLARAAIVKATGGDL